LIWVGEERKWSGWIFFLERGWRKGFRGEERKVFLQREYNFGKKILILLNTIPGI